MGIKVDKYGNTIDYVQLQNEDIDGDCSGKDIIVNEDKTVSDSDNACDRCKDQHDSDETDTKCFKTVVSLNDMVMAEKSTINIGISEETCEVLHRK